MSLRREVGGAVAVAAVTAVWLAGLAALAWSYLGIVFMADETPEGGVRAGRLMLVAVAVLAGGPLVVAGVARALGLGGAARAYLVVALVLVLPAAYGAWVGRHALHPPAPETPWTPPSHCVAYSGGTNTCPGG